MLSPRLLQVLLTTSTLLHDTIKWEPTIAYLEAHRLLSKADLVGLRAQSKSEKWQTLQNLLLDDDNGFWKFLWCLYETGQTALYNRMCPITSLFYPDLDDALTRVPAQSTGNLRYKFNISPIVIAVVGKQFGYAVVEVIKLVQGLPEFVTLSIGQLMVVGEYLGAIQSEESSEFKLVGRIGPNSNALYGKNGPYNPENIQHRQVLGVADVYKFIAPSITINDVCPMEAENGLVLAMEKVQGEPKLSFLSVMSNEARRLLSLTLTEYMELLKLKPLLQNLMQIVMQLPDPIITPQIPIIDEHQQRLALGCIIEKTATYLHFLVLALSERDCVGCYSSRVSPATSHFAAHQHLPFEAAVDAHIAEAVDFINSATGKEKLRRLIFAEPIDPLALSLVYSRFRTVDFTREMYTLLTKYHGPRKLTMNQTLYTELMLASI